MRKKLLFLSLILSAVLLCSCYRSYDFKEKIELPITPSDNEQVEAVEPSFYGVQYIRTNGYNENFEYPRLIKVTSKKSLEFYYENFNGIYFLGHREKIYSDSTVGFVDAISGYDEEYFKTHDIYLAVLEEGSGSIRHSVAGVLDGTSVSITSHSPELCTEDMAEWHIIIEVGKGTVIDKINGKDVPVYTSEEIYEEFIGILRDCALEYLKTSYLTTDVTLGIIERTDFGRAVEEGFDNPFGYSPGYNESPAWRIECTLNGETFALYLCDSPFVFGTVNAPEKPEVEEAAPSLNMATLCDLVKRYGEELGWEELSPYYCEEIGGEMHILLYPINIDFHLLVVGENTEDAPLYLRLVSEYDKNIYIDVRYEDIDRFISTSPSTLYFSYATVLKYAKGQRDNEGVKHSGFVNTDAVVLNHVSDVISRASLECTVEYDSVRVYYDHNLYMWKVNFSKQAQLGGDQDVYLDVNGVTQLIIYGE